jgi:hypothetical protein
MKVKTARTAIAGAETGMMSAEDADVPAAIDLGSFLELFGDGEEELSEQEGPERGERLGQDQGFVRVDPAELLHNQEHRDDDDLLGNDERAEVEDERPPWNLQFNRAKAYPAVAEATRVIKVPTPATPPAVLR